MSDNNKFPFDLFLGGPSTIKSDDPQNKTNLVQNNLSTSSSSESDFTEEELQIFNESILEELKQSIPQNKFKTLFENTFALSDLKEDRAIFLANTKVIKTMILNSYIKNITDALINTLGKPYEVEINVSGVNANLSPNTKNILNPINQEKSNSFYEKNRGKNSLPLPLDPEEKTAITRSSFHLHTQTYDNNYNPSKSIDPEKTFETFISGPSNNLAYASAFAIAQNPGGVDNSKSLYIYSNPGLGKTHLLHAIANKINREHPSLVLFFVSASDFINQFVDARMNDQINNFMKKYTQDVDILMIDDIHGLSHKEGTQDVFFQIFNSLYENKKQLVFTSDKKPKDIIGIPERLKSRLQWGLIVDIQPPDFETKVAILKSYAHSKDVYLSDEIINLIASANTSNIRELESSINFLSLLTTTMNTPLDEAMVIKYLNLDQIKVKKITPDLIVRNVAHFYKLNIADIKSNRRLKELAHARHVSIYLIKKHTSLTLKEIGNVLGGRNYATVIASIHKIEEEIKNNIKLADDIIEIEKKLH